MGWVQVITGVILSSIIPLNNLLLNSYFGNLAVGLHYLRIFSMLAKFQGNQISIVISSINYLNSSVCSLK